MDAISCNTYIDICDHRAETVHNYNCYNKNVKQIIVWINKQYFTEKNNNDSLFPASVISNNSYYYSMAMKILITMYLGNKIGTYFVNMNKLINTAISF